MGNNKGGRGKLGYFLVTPLNLYGNLRLASSIWGYILESTCWVSLLVEAGFEVCCF